MSLVSKSQGYFHSHDGARLYYEVRGEGTPIIWVYGIACLINHFHHQVHEFAKNHRSIIYDLRGHNRSEAPKNLANMTVQDMAKDLVSLLDHLKIEKAHFVGHSFGVPVLINFSDLAPDRALSYTFINGFAKNPIQGMFGLDLTEKLFQIGKGAHTLVPELWNPLWKTVVQSPLTMVVSGLIGGFNLAKTEWKDIEIYSKAVAEMSLEMFIPLFEDMMSFNGEKKAAKIKAPTLVLAGDKDFVTPLSFQKELHQFVRGSKYVVVENGSHCTQLDFPTLVNSKIQQHIKRAELKETQKEV